MNRFAVTSPIPGAELTEALRRTEIGLSGAHTTHGGEGGPWENIGSWRFVASEWPSCGFELRIEGFVTTDGLTGMVRLVRADTNALAHAGNLEIDSPEPVHVARALSLSEGVLYLLQQRFDVAAGDSFILLGARLHIARS